MSRIAPKLPKDRAKTVDNYLNQVLENRDIELGLNGIYMFRIDIKLLDGSFEPFLGINNLTMKAAQLLFNQFDESNFMFAENGKTNTLRIGIYSAKDKDSAIDFNILPNIFSEIFIL